ncbi:MAG: cation-transporting P-type ATPase, partial [Eubacteriales bacterium]
MQPAYRSSAAPMPRRISASAHRKTKQGTGKTERTETEIPVNLCSLSGLSDEQAEENRRRFGTNALSRAKRTPFLYRFLSGFRDPIIGILLGALAVNCLFLFRTFDIWETAGIVTAILCATLISALSEHGGELAFEHLQAEASRTECLCRRGGKDVRVPIDALAAGDIVSLSAGERIPADGILVRGGLRVSMAALNGEGRETERSAQKPFSPVKWTPDDKRLLLRGATVTWGEGQMLCLRVGDNTLFGSLMGELQTETRDSPLRTRLSGLAKQMSFVGGCAAAAVALSYLVNTFFIDAGLSLAGTKVLLSDPAFVLSALVHALMLATTMLVVAVPEGLPMMISVVLSANIRRMQRDNVLVRKPVGIETAGSLNMLFC